MAQAPATTPTATTPATLSLTIRLSSGQRFAVTVPSPESTTIGDAKVVIEESFGDDNGIEERLEAARQRLVYKGRILDDDSKTMAESGITESGSTIFLVMGGKKKQQQTSSTGTSTRNSTSTSTSSSPANTNPSGFNPWGGGATASASSFPNPFFGNTGGGTGGVPSMQEMMNNPPSQQQMQQMMNNPMVQQMMDNPETMRSALEFSMRSNPQLRELMESNPQLREVYDNPEMLRQMSQMMRNPQMMQQFQRNQELAMSQIENMPGGFSALSSMYRNMQEPLMEAQIGGASVNNANANGNSNSTLEGSTGAAMPNPWGSPSSSSTGNPSLGNSNTTNNNNTNNAPNPWAAMGGGGGVPGLMPGGTQADPDQMMAMLENPMVQQMMQRMVDQNPGAIRQMLEAQNPVFRQMFAGNPDLADGMVRQMMNPQALRGALEMQRAMGGGAGGVGGAGSMPGAGSNTASAPGFLDFTGILPPGTGPQQQQRAPPDFASMMQQMENAFRGGGRAGGAGSGGFFGAPSPHHQQQQQQHPSDRYRSQLNSLRDMGFDDERLCLEVLSRNNGNLNRAVDALLMGPPPPAATTTAAAAPASASPSPPTDNAQSEELPDPKNDRDKKDD